MENSPYFELGRPGPGGSVHDFVLNSLLRSRIDCGFESNAEHFDEEVNVYLVYLLAALVTNPARLGGGEIRDIDVFERVRDCRDPGFKGEIYRTNADHLLLSTGIFIDSPYSAQGATRRFEVSAQARIGRGKAYYHFAAMFLGQRRAGSAAIPRVLDRLSIDFERYVEVLFHMRGEYLHLYPQLTEDAMPSISLRTSEPTDEIDTRSDLERMRDDFLDAYWAWHESPNPASRAELIEISARLAAIDPLFTFRLEEN